MTIWRIMMPRYRSMSKKKDSLGFGINQEKHTKERTACTRKRIDYDGNGCPIDTSIYQPPKQHEMPRIRVSDLPHDFWKIIRLSWTFFSPCQIMKQTQKKSLKSFEGNLPGAADPCLFLCILGSLIWEKSSIIAKWRFSWHYFRFFASFLFWKHSVRWLKSDLHSNFG